MRPNAMERRARIKTPGNGRDLGSVAIKIDRYTRSTRCFKDAWRSLNWRGYRLPQPSGTGNLPGSVLKIEARWGSNSYLSSEAARAILRGSNFLQTRVHVGQKSTSGK